MLDSGTGFSNCLAPCERARSLQRTTNARASMTSDMTFVAAAAFQYLPKQQLLLHLINNHQQTTS